MKSFIRMLAVAASLAAVPVLSFAQTNAADAQAATSTVQQGNSAPASGYGGAADGSADSGAAAGHHRFLRRNTGRTQPNDDCVGPVSFCNIYFGS
jgi:hypothetical protein